MRTDRNVDYGNRSVVPKELTRVAVIELARDLFNQLTVVNLCSGQLSASLGSTCDPVAAANLEMIARAAKEAAALAERVALLIAESRPTEPRRSAKSENPGTQASKISRLF